MVWWWLLSFFVSGSKRRVEGRGALSKRGSYCLFENIFIQTATQLELSIVFLIFSLFALSIFFTLLENSYRPI
jgi:uncharacterized membrane protein